MKRALIISLISAAMAAAQGQAPQQAQPQTLAGVVRLNRIPVSNEVLKVKLPRPVERQLPNGMKLLVVESHRVPSISLRITLPAGDLRNPPDLNGVSDATAALIRLGTRTLNSKEIAEKARGAGRVAEHLIQRGQREYQSQHPDREFRCSAGSAGRHSAQPELPAGRIR